MATTVAVACPRFSQNAWKREMCSNCFKTRNEHPAPPTRQLAAPPSRHATPKQSILKGGGKGRGRTPASVCFPPSEAEVIGYDGGDPSSDSDDEPDTPAPTQNGHDETLYPEPSEEEEKALQNLTRRNTDFNSENANLLKESPAPPPVKKHDPPRIELGRKSNGTPVVSVTPFGQNKPFEIPKATPVPVTITPVAKTTTSVSITKSAPVSVTQSVPAPKPVQQPPPPQEKQEADRAPHTERRPPLGHESTSAPLTAPALVKLQVKETSPPPSQPEQPEPQVTPESPKPPAFLRHKDSVDLISPPASPRLHSKTEERPNPIGKVSSTLTVTLKSPGSPPSGTVSPTESGGRRRLVEARSSALIRRWTVGERVLIQPRRPVLDAPEIVPLNLQSSKQQQSMGLEPRELAGQPDGEDSTMPSEPAPIVVVEPPLKPEPEKIVPVNRVEDFIEIRVRDKADQPPTPPSSPLPEEDNPVSASPVPAAEEPPSLPSSPPPVLQSKSTPPPVLQSKSTPAPSKPPPQRPTSLPTQPAQRPTSLPAQPVTPRSSFLHGAMLGRPQVPAKPASLLASIASAVKRHTVATSPTVIAVSTPQLPSPELRQCPAETAEKDTAPSTPSTPDMHNEAPVYDTPKQSVPMSEAKPPISSNKPPKFSGGSYKKRQAPKPPVPGDIKTHVRTPSQDSFEDLSRRDGFDKSPPSKKNNARFSLRRLLRLGKDERATSPESPSSPTSSPSPPGSPNRPEIIHPSMLDGREVQVVSRIQQSQTSPQPINCVNSTTPAGRPRPPPPPPRTLSLSGSSPPNPRPSRPPPPQSAQLLQMKERATETPSSEEDEHAVYANLDSVKNRNFNAANKPQRNGSLREGSPEWGQQMSPTSEDGDYETVQFLDGRLSRRRRSAVLSSLEENYGAVVGANHRALAQLVASLCAVPLPACASTALTTYAEEQGEGDETRTLVLLQSLAVLRDLQDVGTSLANMAHFHVLRPFENQKAAIGPRVKHLPTGELSSESLKEIGHRACQLLQPSDPKLCIILTSSGLAKAVAYLEFKTWGPELDQSDKEVGLQRWLDLERATALQNLAQARDRLPVAQEMYVNFLVQASAIGLSQASLL